MLVAGRHSHVIVLTLALLASTALAVEATPFDHTYFFHDATLLGSNVGANNAIRVEVASVLSPFDLRVSATELTPEQFAMKAGVFSGFSCLSYLSDPNCIEYNVAPTQPGLYTGPIVITIAWLLDTNPITTSPFMIQAEGSAPYSSQLRNQHYFDHSTGGIHFCRNDDENRNENRDDERECDDPADTGTTDNFSRFAIVYSPVPEPGTLLLVGSGAVAALYRSRRQRRQR